MFKPPAELLYLLEDQEGIISRAQAFAHGASPAHIRAQLAAGRWSHVHPGAYATFTGSLTFTQRVWAAVLVAGDRAMASHETAAFLLGLASREPEVIRITVPAGRHLAAPDGVRITRSHRTHEARHRRKVLPQTSVEDTVLDLVDEKSRADEVVGLITSACQKRLTSPTFLAKALTRRRRCRWRKLLTDLLAAVREGVESPLEWRYAKDVERAHGLPKPTRQAKVKVGGRIYIRDVFYEEFATVVELDGRAAHPDDEAHRDMRRDNASAGRQEVTLRYGWADVAGRPCEVAAQVAEVLRSRGWKDRPRRCGPSCAMSDRRL